MRIINKTIVIIISITAFIYFTPIQITTEAYSDNIKFESITTDQGLSQNTVYSIIQDKYGYLWFGTRDGLNKYDGIQFTIYRYDPSNQYSLANNAIRSIYEDSHGDIWIGTDYGLHKFNRVNETFTRYLNDSNNPGSISSSNITKIYEDSLGNLWIGTNNGVNKFNRELNNFVRYLSETDNQNSISGKYVHSIYEDKHGELWIGTDFGLNKYNRKTETFSYYLHDTNDSNSIINNVIRSIFEDNYGNLWVGTNDGLDKFDKELNMFIHYLVEPNNPDSISGNIIYSLCEDSFGNFWIGTNKGLNRYDRELNRFIHYLYDSDDPFSINSQSIWSIYEDRDNVLWIGTHNGGVNKLDYRKSAFKYYGNKLNDSNSLSNNIIWAIYEDHNGDLWIGTDYGLNCYNRKTETFTHYINNPNDPSSISYNVITSIYEDSYNILWIGTAGGLNRFNSETNNFTRFICDPNNENTLSNDFVRLIYEDNKNNLWISTKGLDKFDRDTEKIDRYSDNFNYFSNIKVMLEDHNGDLWIGTNNGLYKYNTEINTYTHYLYDINCQNCISNNEITSIYEDHFGNLWIGTNYGLNQLDIATNNFKHYTSENGLRSNSIKGILGDDYGNLWISTGGGLSKFNSYTEKFINYTACNGLQGDEFNQSSCFKSSSGEFFFGGLNGLTSFYPEAIVEDTITPIVIINDFTLIDKAISFNEPIEDVREIILPYSDNSFVIDFIALNYKAPEFNQYCFILENFDNNWQYCSALNSSIRYTNIPSGKYIFRVIASNSDGFWNYEGSSLKIIISPPFWEEWWFILSLIIAAILFIYLFIQYRTYTLQKYSQKLENKFEEKTYQLVHKSEQLENELLKRAEFTRALAHELKTPLTPILSSSEFLMNTVEDDITLGFINNIRQGILNLEKRINELMDLAKGEVGLIKLHCEYIYALNVIKDSISYFIPESQKKKQSLILDIPDILPKIYADEDRIKQVILNLLNNASKFTRRNGTITLKAKEENENIIVEVIDNGCGIDDSELEHIFEPYSKLRLKKESLSGLGLGLYLAKLFIELHSGKIWVKSTKGKGSTFAFSLPIQHNDDIK